MMIVKEGTCEIQSDVNHPAVFDRYLKHAKYIAM